jgi:putative ATP-dependent endonuclease of OLD family
MHLQTVAVKNFRNLKNVSVAFRPGLNALVGRNNVGKSNIFLAIRHALGATAQWEAVGLDEDDIYREAKKLRIETTIRVDLTFADLSNKQLAQFFEILVFNPAAPNNSTAQIHFEATWSSDRKRFSIRRWGGPDGGEQPQVPAEILEALPVTFLPALRDADAALMPGSRSKLARVLELWAKKRGTDDEKKFKEIFEAANKALGEEPLVTTIQSKLQTSTQKMAGTDYTGCSIKAADDVDFTQILRTLRILVDDNPVQDIAFSGLGYNNLLYIATVLAQLSDSQPDECPILLIEEPEAHLHPQLTILLGNYLRDTLTVGATPQALVSTHSPTFAANVSPSQVCCVFKDAAGEIQFRPLADVNFSPQEERELQRMLDVTRATLYFSKRIILVEGISEALLIPELAERLKRNLARSHVSVIPICGVAFETFSKLLKPEVLGIPTAIVTDADPTVERNGQDWKGDEPKKIGGVFEQSQRTKNVLNSFASRVGVKVCPSKVTLEYDLAEAGDKNSDLMAIIWKQQFKGNPQTLNRELVAANATKEAKALTVWRGICRANHTGSKAEFAHCLADWLARNRKTDFAVPSYIEDAVKHLIPNEDPIAA